MADVRSLLRQERASRQQQTSGRPQKQSAAPAAAPTSKKRKATEENAEERKRTRTEVDRGVPTGFFEGGATVETEGEPTLTADIPTREEPQSLNPPSEVAHRPLQHLAPAEIDELDEFLNEMAATPVAPPQVHSYSVGAVIEAAPMTAAEIAAQAREQQSVQRAKQDDELEAEKEDAARQLEDEFEEMEGLEERVRKLREKREALRTQGKVENSALAEPEPMVEDEEESDLDEEEWDEWGFRPV